MLFCFFPSSFVLAIWGAHVEQGFYIYVSNRRGNEKHARLRRDTDFQWEMLPGRCMSPRPGDHAFATGSNDVDVLSVIKRRTE